MQRPQNLSLPPSPFPLTPSSVPSPSPLDHPLSLFLCRDSNLARKTSVGTRLRKADFPLKGFQASREYGRGVVRTIVRSTIRFAFRDIRSRSREKIDRFESFDAASDAKKTGEDVLYVNSG